MSTTSSNRNTFAVPIGTQAEATSSYGPNPERQPLIPRSSGTTGTRTNDLTPSYQGKLGFKKKYNFRLWLIFGGSMLVFSVTSLPWLSTRFFSSSVAPGEWFWFRQSLYRVGIKLHLGAILPCGFLSVFQFIPAIRYKNIGLHRLNGYVVLGLLYLGIVGALMITRHAFGGSVASQSGLGVLSLVSGVSAALAYYNIRCLQIDQHRKWMLRSMFAMASVLTVRILQVISSIILSNIGGYYTLWRCDELAFTIDDPLKYSADYPVCSILPSDGMVAVLARFGEIEQVGSVFRLTFGPSIWIAMFLHLAGLELYLHLTPAESERLRNVSYQRQLEAGHKHPGSSGLTSDRLGDADTWTPK